MQKELFDLTDDQQAVALGQRLNEFKYFEEWDYHGALDLALRDPDYIRDGLSDIEWYSLDWERVSHEVRGNVSATPVEGEEGSWTAFMLRDGWKITLVTGVCTHTELGFTGEMEVQSGSLVFHVECRGCGRAGTSYIDGRTVDWEAER